MGFAFEAMPSALAPQLLGKGKQGVANGGVSPDFKKGDPMRHLLNRLRKNQRGANLVEYVLLVGLMAIICLAAFKIFGGKIKEKITGYSDTVDTIQTTSQ
jgi:Flp pilus assembly pilin Flp